MWQKYINTDIKETYNQAEHQISRSNTADTATLCDADWLVCAAQHLQRDQQITQKNAKFLHILQTTMSLLYSCPDKNFVV